MAEWESKPRSIDLRNPYAVWSKEVRRIDERRARFVVPVFLKITSEEPSKGYDQLAAMLEKESKREEKEENASPRFFISNLEKPIFQSRITREDASGEPDETEGRPEPPDTLFRRLILVYAYEDALYPDQDDVEPILNGENGIYERWFVGHAIPDTVSALQQTERLVDPFGLRETDPTTALAIIDDSFAFLNDIFTKVGKDGSEASMFRQLRFQDGERIIDGEVYSGAIIDHFKILELLKEKTTKTEQALYQTNLLDSDLVEYRPLDFTTEDHQALAFPISHGTAVADAALKAFYANQEDSRPELELFGITVPPDATQDTSGQMIGTYLLLAIWQALVWTEELNHGRDGVDENGNRPNVVPLVINFSFGFSAGPKDGSSELNQRVKALLDDQNENGFPTVLVVPMGNAALSQTVIETELKHEETQSVTWVVQPDDKTANFLEIYSDVEGVKVVITPPNSTVNPVEFELISREEGNLRLLKDGENTLAAVGNWRSVEGSAWAGRGFVALGPTTNIDHPSSVVPSGNWTVTISNLTKGPASVVGLIQRDDAAGTYPALGRQSYFEHEERAIKGSGLTGPEDKAVGGPIVSTRTGSVFASIDSSHVIVVGAGMGQTGDIDGERPAKPSPYASLGPRAISKLGPDFTELSDRSDYFRGIYCAGTYSGTSFPISGSSIASPTIAGHLAANPQNIPIPVDQWPDVDPFEASVLPGPKEKKGRVLRREEPVPDVAG